MQPSMVLDEYISPMLHMDIITYPDPNPGSGPSLANLCSH